MELGSPTLLISRPGYSTYPDISFEILAKVCRNPCVVYAFSTLKLLVKGIMRKKMLYCVVVQVVKSLYIEGLDVLPIQSCPLY